MLESEREGEKESEGVRSVSVRLMWMAGCVLVVSG